MKGKIALINATFMAAVENKVALPGTKTNAERCCAAFFLH